MKNEDFIKWKYVSVDTYEIVEAFLYDGDFTDRFGNYYVPKWAKKALDNKVLRFDGPDLYWNWSLTVNSKSILFKAVIIPNETYIIAKDEIVIATIDKRTFNTKYKKIKVIENKDETKEKECVETELNAKKGDFFNLKKEYIDDRNFYQDCVRLEFIEYINEKINDKTIKIMKFKGLNGKTFCDSIDFIKKFFNKENEKNALCFYTKDDYKTNNINSANTMLKFVKIYDSDLIIVENIKGKNFFIEKEKLKEYYYIMNPLLDFILKKYANLEIQKE